MGEDASAPDFIVLHERDNVATALKSLPVGVTAQIRWTDGRYGQLRLDDAIGLGHKVALVPIARGQLIIKHGYPMGRTTAEIAVGEHVHVHNVVSLSMEDRGDRPSGQTGAEGQPS